MDDENEIFLNEDKIERTNGTFSSLSTFFKIMPGRLDKFEVFSVNINTKINSLIGTQHYRPSQGLKFIFDELTAFD